jgi:hypothetical protein
MFDSARSCDGAVRFQHRREQSEIKFTQKVPSFSELNPTVTDHPTINDSLGELRKGAE